MGEQTSQLLIIRISIIQLALSLDLYMIYMDLHVSLISEKQSAADFWRSMLSENANVWSDCSRSVLSLRTLVGDSNKIKMLCIRHYISLEINTHTIIILLDHHLTTEPSRLEFNIYLSAYILMCYVRFT